jgi:hypothetical protein
MGLLWHAEKSSSTREFAAATEVRLLNRSVCEGLSWVNYLGGVGLAGC